MANFLVKLDNQGKIEEVKWTTDPSLISRGKSLLDMMEEEKAEDILHFLAGHPDGTLKQDTLQLKQGSTLIQISLYLFNLEGRNMGIGISGKAAEEPVIEGLLKIYNELLNQLRQEVKKSTDSEEEKIQEQFEELQKLNNELTNTQRKIEKANFKLENLNRELQTKLMKDPLTGLVGRYQFWVGIKGMIDNAPEKKGIFVYLDVDDLKKINDTFGHVAGDKFLVEIGNRLKSIPLDNSMKIRISGDEFGIFVHGYEKIKEENFQEIWNLIQKYLSSEPFTFNQIPIPVSITAGMAAYNFDTREVGELIEFADFAMYRAKREGKNRFRRFDREDFERKRLEKDQSRAVKEVIEDEDLYHVYQPIFSGANGEIYGYAAHMRTNNKHFRDTKDLIERAFRENLYVELDLLSFQKLSREKELAESMGEKSLFVSHGPYSFVHNEDIKKGAGNLFPNRLVLEIVEGKMATPEFIGKIIRNGKKYGFRVAVASFVSGDFDDLGILATNPAFIKIGREITEMVLDDREQQEKIKRIIGYAHSQGTRVIMEGIETKKELEMAIRLNADYLQGFFLGSPEKEPPPEIEKSRKTILSSRQKK